MEKQKLVYAKLDATTITELVGDTVALRLLGELTFGSKRFSELQKAVGASSKTVSARLKTLANNGLVSKALHAEVPPRSEYTLTEKGAEFVHIIQGILEWETNWE